MAIEFIDIRDIEGRLSGFNIETHGDKVVVVVRGVLTHGTVFEASEFLEFALDSVTKLWRRS